MWQEAERARAEVKKRGTPPSIPQGARSTFAYEEDAEGRLKRVIDEPGPAPGSLVGPGRYSPSGLSSGPRVDFKSGSGRNLPVAPGRPPTLLPGAPGWHDGLTSNPLPPQDLPSSSFALPPDALSFLAAATSDHAEADRGCGGSGWIAECRCAGPSRWCSARIGVLSQPHRAPLTPATDGWRGRGWVC